MKTIRAVDLFCGAGGTSAGLCDVAEQRGYKLDLLAINHWDIAIATHMRNHTKARHMCESLDNVNPRKAVPGGWLDIMLASPECTHHSNARGGKPCSDQSRASAWHVLRWAEALRIDGIIAENVREFESWGPLGVNGRPLKSKKGETFKAWIAALESLGYRVEYRILNSADYGAATARRRLFVLAKRGNKKIVWPEITHGPTTSTPYRAAREIIDWDYPSTSIFERKKPLADNTLRRIEAGLRKFCGEPFLTMLYGTGGVRGIDRSCPTVTAGGNHIGVCEPFIMPIDNASSGASGAKSVDEPLPTIIASNDRLGIVQPFITKYYGTGGADSVDKPLATATAKARFGLCEPESNGLRIDIRFRMLQPHELADAMGMGDFEFEGNKGDKTKQIGNAVERHQARALCDVMLA